MRQHLALPVDDTTVQTLASTSEMLQFLLVLPVVPLLPLVGRLVPGSSLVEFAAPLSALVDELFFVSVVAVTERVVGLVLVLLQVGWCVAVRGSRLVC